MSEANITPVESSNDDDYDGSLWEHAKQVVSNGLTGNISYFNKMYYLNLYFNLSQVLDQIESIQELTRNMTKLDHELKTTKQDRDLWKTRYINRSLRGITARSLGEITTIKRAVIERDKWQHRYGSEVDSNLF